MASANKPRVKVPKKAAAGDIITIKTLISHKMESGQRKDKDGAAIPRKIINHFKAEFAGQTVFETVIEPGMSANPFLSFSAKVQESGDFQFTWTDDDGSVYEASKSITVS